jgi:hypothetical protein
MLTLTKFIAAASVLFAFQSTAQAEDARATLAPGSYQAGVGGCKNPTGVGTMTFDGTNFSGNGQFCKTDHLGGDRYRLTCIGLANGTDKPRTKADFSSVPDAEKDKIEISIKVKGKHAVEIDGTPYEFCRAKL